MKEFYTAQELAALLEVNPRTILRLEQRGELKPHRIGRVKRFRKEVIEAYLKRAKK
jgi:excisionase family DNA binding protein